MSLPYDQEIATLRAQAASGNYMAELVCRVFDSVRAEQRKSTLVRCATTANINLASTGLTAIDGVTPVAGDRVLVKNQSTGSQNGIYVASVGAWTRALDDSGAQIVAPGMSVAVQEGTTLADTRWFCTNNSITVGSTSISFARRVGAFFQTAADQTGSGSAQSIAHGLGVVPAVVVVYPTDTSPATVGVYTVTEGVHDATNVIVTVTTSKKYKVLALA